MSDNKQTVQTTLFEKLIIGLVFGGAVGFILYIFFKGAAKYNLYNEPLFYVILLAICCWLIFGLWAFVHFPLFSLLDSKIGDKKRGELKAALIFSGYLVAGIVGSLVLGDVLTGHGELFVPIFFIMIFPAGIILIIFTYLFRSWRKKRNN